MADYFLYHNVEEGRENKVCLYYEDQTWTYGDVVRLSNQTGNALRDLSLEVEDRILLVLPDCPEFVWTWFGAARIGAVITMVNPLLPAADYEYYLDYTRARVAVVFVVRCREERIYHRDHRTYSRCSKPCPNKL